MTSERSQAYGRVMRTLDVLGPARLQAAEAQLLRDAADALLFCERMADCPDARTAVDDVATLVRHLVAAGRWLPETGEHLIGDVTACGPLVLV